MQLGINTGISILFKTKKQMHEPIFNFTILNLVLTLMAENLTCLSMSECPSGFVVVTNVS